MNDNELIFFDYLPDFFHYMVTMGGLVERTGRDCITRLKFLSKDYRLDASLTEEVIDDIMRQEAAKMPFRAEYNSRHALNDLKSGLRKFLNFIQSDYEKLQEDTVISEIKKIYQNQQLDSTEKEAIVKARIGQGQFRKNLIGYWKGCSVTGYNRNGLLMASHIKPWCQSDNASRIDVFNGLLLTPNLDKLFDAGYISFADNGDILISKMLDQYDKKCLHIEEDMRLTKLSDNNKPYLNYHRKNCYLN